MDSAPRSHLDPGPGPEHEAGARLAALEGRLRLLLLHLSGPAVRARVEVDDLLQEVYLRALARPEQLARRTDTAALFAYLATLARHTVVDVVRAARAQKRAGGEQPLARSDWSRATPPGGRVVAVTPGPATRAQADEAAQRMTTAFLALQPEHRRVIGLRQFEGLTAAQAARRMGRSEVAVHSLYRRALEAWERAWGGFS